MVCVEFLLLQKTFFLNLYKVYLQELSFVNVFFFQSFGLCSRRMILYPELSRNKFDLLVKQV